MRIWTRIAPGCVVLAAAGLIGCETTGSNQLQTTVVDTHRRIVKLDRNLETAVNQLSDTTSDLTERVERSDQNTQALREMIEQNQTQLTRLQGELTSLKNSIYREWNLSAPSAPRTPEPGVGVGDVTIERPDEIRAPALETTATAQRTPTPEARDAERLDAGAAASTGDPRADYQRAQRSYAGEEYHLALQQFGDFLRQYPDEPELAANAQFWRAKSYLNLGQYPESIEEFEALRRSFPTSSKVPFALHNQAVAHSRIGQNAQAERLMQDVVDNFPTSPAADQARSDLQKLRGQ